MALSAGGKCCLVLFAVLDLLFLVSVGLTRARVHLASIHFPVHRSRHNGSGRVAGCGGKHVGRGYGEQLRERGCRHHSGPSPP